ncbi:MAG TPA: choice-of-anchor Q domain-containing protein [Nocardioides sp.]|nr:choice-of-anchor Q domain-containing protein [Nocardioides sp.]
MTTRRYPALAWATTSALGIGLALTSLPADAATSPAATSLRATTSTPREAATARRGPVVERLSTAQLTQVRARQAQILAEHRPAPAFAGAVARAGAKPRRFTVDTTEDSGLANAAGTRCIDDVTGACSLRAAVDAANNRRAPVKVVLGRHTYMLSSATQLTVTNPAGTSIVGAGARHTTIQGHGSRVLEETQSSTSARRPLLFLRDLKITGGSADVGAGVNLDATSNDAVGATLQLEGVTISGNTATESGGGINAVNRGTLYATHSTITRNAAPEGAGLTTYWSDVSLTDVSIVDNHASIPNTAASGGGWQNRFGVVRMKGGSISDNSAGDATSYGAGGGLFDAYGNVSLTGVQIDGNTAYGNGDAGGIYATLDLLRFDGGSISHNRAVGDISKGGGIYVWLGAQIGLHGVDLRDDKVVTQAVTEAGGGAMYLDVGQYDNRFTLDSGTTVTRSNGSAIYIWATDGQANLDIDHSRLSHNQNATATSAYGTACGGVICGVDNTHANVNLTMTGNTLVGNSSTAPQPRGAGAISLVSGDTLGVRVHLQHNVFQDNTSGASGLGGAVGIVSVGGGDGGSLLSASNTFVGNHTGTSAGAGRGGAIGVEKNVLVSDSRSTFRHNRAVGDGAYGGAVYSDGQLSSRFVGSVFSGNSSGPATGGEGYGGAVYTNDTGGTTFTGVTVTDNRTATLGGGIDVASATASVSVERSTIAGNQAGNAGTDGLGGGLYVERTLTVDNSTVVRNRAQGDGGAGGGVYVNQSTLGVSYTTVTGNVARHGGGLASATVGGTLLGSIVTLNHASPGGAEQDCLANAGFASLRSLGGNLLGQAGCVTATTRSDRVTRHPHLTKLRDNGGQTETMALTPKSPAIGRATFQCPATDQRGRQRPTTHCDAGGFELPKVKHHHHHH